MNLGVFSYFGYRLPLAKRLEMIARAGFDTTCIWWGPEEEMFGAGLLERVPGLAQEHGLHLENMHVPFDRANELWTADGALRDAYVRRHRGWIEDCRRCGIERMVMHLSTFENGPGPTEQGLEAFADIVKAAEDADVVLAVENVRRNDVLESVLERFDSPAVGLCYDSSHDNLWGRPLGAVLKKWGHRLVQTHFSDNFGQTDDHLVPSEGSIDWGAVAAAFPRGFTGALTLESQANDKAADPASNSTTCEPQAYLARSLRQLKWLAAKLGR